LEADISTWQKTGHFYFALTEESGPILVLDKAWKSEPVKAVVREPFSVLIRLIHDDSSCGRRELGAKLMAG